MPVWEYYHPDMATLHIVATPIGNLGDLSARALEVLTSVDLIAAEDTRVTRRLLSRYGISTRLTSYHEHSPASKLESLLESLADGDVAVVCDAGTPGISDAGRELVSAAAAAGAAVVAVPGPSAVTSAVSVSGLAIGGFVFLGFLPRARGERRALLADRAGERLALVAFEAARRLRSSLTDILDVLGDRQIAVCREITKVHEEVFRGPISGALDHFTQPRGELTLVVEGARDRLPDPGALEEEAARMLARLRSGGTSGRDAVSEVTRATGLAKRRVYELWRGG